MWINDLGKVVPCTSGRWCLLWCFCLIWWSIGEVGVKERRDVIRLWDFKIWHVLRPCVSWATPSHWWWLWIVLLGFYCHLVSGLGNCNSAFLSLQRKQAVFPLNVALFLSISWVSCREELIDSHCRKSLFSFLEHSSFPSLITYSPVPRVPVASHSHSSQTAHFLLSVVVF